MSEVVISVENLSKQYRLGAIGGRTLQDDFKRWLARLRGRPDPLLKIGQEDYSGRRGETIWALRDVSLQVKQGEVLGIIGRNGAGKSTLLKILSRITAPTMGQVKVKGRVGSLLEVGTGFHPELTGQENIYLNGAILGMTRAEIKRKYDEIVAFAEVEKFLDTPVKRYSSGMYVRLAFAVAAHLEPEILLVDEVLAVGDAAFQQKCLGKMGDVARAGRTILFVSHNMNAIQRLCGRSLILEQGCPIEIGSTPSMVVRYLARNPLSASPNSFIDLRSASRHGTGNARFTGLCYSSLNEATGFQPYSNGPVEFLLDIESDKPRTVGSLAITFYDQYGTKLVNADTIALGQSIMLAAGTNVVRVRIHRLHLTPGIFAVGLWLAPGIGNEYDEIEVATNIEVVDLQPEGLGLRAKCDGFVTCDFEASSIASPSNG